MQRCKNINKSFVWIRIANQTQKSIHLPAKLTIISIVCDVFEQDIIVYTIWLITKIIKRSMSFTTISCYDDKDEYKYYEFDDDNPPIHIIWIDFPLIKHELWYQWRHSFFICASQKKSIYNLVRNLQTKLCNCQSNS